MRMLALAIVVTVLCDTSMASAQDISGGLKAGISVSNISFEAEGNDVAFDRETGFTGGGFVTFPVNGRFGVQVEALFTQKGSRIAGAPGPANTEIDYIEAPVMARYTPILIGRVSVHVFAGPSLGFRVRAKSVGTSVEGEEIERDISDDLTRIDFALAGGAGMEVGRVVIDGRYTWGITDIDKNKSHEVKANNRAFLLMGGFRF